MMSRYTVIRLLDTFFRRWWLYLIPVLFLGMLGAYSVSKTKDTFKSVGTMNVASSTLLDKLSDVNTAPNFGWETPAAATAKKLGSQLRTTQFLNDVVLRAGLSDRVTAGTVTLADVRSAIVAWDDGTNLVHIAASFGDPVTAQKLADATMAAFFDSVLTANLTDSQAAITFYGGQVATMQANLQAAKDEAAKYRRDHPEPASGKRTDDDAAELARLDDVIASAQAAYDGAVGKQMDAQLAAEQTKSLVGTRLAVVDKPEVPLGREPKLKGMVLTFAMFLALGGIVMGAGVLIATSLDHGLRTSDEVRQRLGVAVVAAVPDAGRLPIVTGTVSALPRRTDAGGREPRRGREMTLVDTGSSDEDEATAPGRGGPGRRLGGRATRLSSLPPSASPSTSPAGNARRAGTLGRPEPE